MNETDRERERLTFFSANLCGKICAPIYPAPLELLLEGNASELVDTDFSDLVLKKTNTKIKIIIITITIIAIIIRRKGNCKFKSH